MQLYSLSQETSGIEEELEVLYNAYYGELEQYAILWDAMYSPSLEALNESRL